MTAGCSQRATPCSMRSSRSGPAGACSVGAIAGAAVLGTNLLNVAFQLSTARLLPPPETRCWSRCSRSCSSRTSRSSRCRRGSPATSPASPRRAIAMRSGPSSSTACGRWRAGGRAWWCCLHSPSIPLSITFEVKRELPFLALAIAVIATLPLPISWGGLQGLERFPTLAGQLFYGVLKLAVGVGLAAAGSARPHSFGVAAGDRCEPSGLVLPLARGSRRASAGARHPEAPGWLHGAERH